jgi:hypothetical protein
MNVRKLNFSLLILAFTASLAFAATQTLTGVVTDDMCGKKHTMMPGQPDAQCIRECVRAGSHYALQSGDKLYILQGDTKQFDALAGKKVKVTGDVNGTTLAVSAITESK